MPIAAIIASNIELYFSEMVTFCEVFVKYGLLHTDEVIFISNNVTFYNIKASSLINGSINHIINLVNNACVTITNVNVIHKVFSLINQPASVSPYSYPFCYFQYYQKHYGNKIMSQRIIILSKDVDKIFDYSTGNVNCKFKQDSIYAGLNPLEVYLQHTEMEHKDKLFNTGFLCSCQGMQPNCYINTLGSIYPGQNIAFNVSLNPETFWFKNMPITTSSYECSALTLLEEQYNIKCFCPEYCIAAPGCTELNYVILSKEDTYCKLFLYSDSYVTVYFMKVLKCPLGFSPGTGKFSRRCICDPILVVNKVTQECNINDQTILRPAISWISATTAADNNSYTYHISLHCPFQYCLSYSSYFRFSNSNSQCQFSRSGLLCGQCQRGLSTVFSSINCKVCSNIYLLLIIPIAVIGFFLVILLLFDNNLTVTDGAINGFILYANIISINNPAVFLNYHTTKFMPSYTYISLVNLDLGIQTCFYNGMDDYAKMWLQLVFPIYLIFISTLIIITSRYSTTIQRLTARRVLPVLATLFLLSYTKILRIVSSVLFFYSTITHLPSNHKTRVWSVDANVPLFEARFTILFIVCLLLFLILLPFNAILLFTKTSLRFAFVSRFIPIIDAYQGPYKRELYYWPGLQLMIRIVFFGLALLERNLNLLLGSIFLGIMMCIQAAVCPFKSKIKNYQELLVMLNLQIVYISLLYDKDAVLVHLLIMIAAFHLTLLVFCYIINNLCGEVIKRNVQLIVSTLRALITRLSNKPQHARFQLQDSVRNNIPEVAFNYNEYLEPLMGQN